MAFTYPSMKNHQAKLKKKLIKNKCEIAECGETDPSTLHLHHIIERTDPNTTNDIMNLALLCASCHSKVHAKKIKLIGIYPSTKPPNNRTLIYELDGKKNIDGVDKPYLELKPKSYKI